MITCYSLASHWVAHLQWEPVRHPVPSLMGKCHWTCCIRLLLDSSIWLHDMLICTLGHSIFSQPSGYLIIPAFQYWIAFQADLYTQPLNIQSTFSLSDYACIPILNCMSGWSLHSTIEYSLHHRLIWLLLDFIIWLHVRLICTLSHQIFSHPLAIPIIPAFQYWIACQADLYTQPLNIHSTFGLSDTQFSHISPLKMEQDAWQVPNVDGPPSGWPTNNTLSLSKDWPAWVCVPLKMDWPGLLNSHWSPLKMDWPGPLNFH
jgi:hypothetical protein